jgi:hypothetical protein
VHPHAGIVFFEAYAVGAEPNWVVAERARKHVQQFGPVDANGRSAKPRLHVIHGEVSQDPAVPGARPQAGHARSAPLHPLLQSHSGESMEGVRP